MHIPWPSPDVLFTAALDLPVFVVEGEKDADRLASDQIKLTTRSGAALRA